MLLVGRRLMLAAAGLSLFFSMGCRQDPPQPAPTPVASASPAAAPPSPASASATHLTSGPSYFRDATAALGMTFVHQQGKNLIYMPDTSSPGAALFDYDGDGWLDVFLVQGTGTVSTHDPAKMPPSHLYRRKPDGRLEECAAAAAVANRGWAQACLAWDFDNDGYEDLMVTAYQEPVRLYRNDGDGTFREVAKKQGVTCDDMAWASCMAAIDADRDGWLEVYVGQYVDFKTADFIKDPPLEDASGTGMVPKTLVPGRYGPLSKRFFYNLAGTGFRDITRGYGLEDARTRTYGIVSCDLDDDGFPDLFVANDASICSMFANENGKFFSSRGGESWVAENRGSMGIAVGDVDLNGMPDLLITHWFNPPALYKSFVGRRGQKKMRFVDRAVQMGLDTEPMIGWGVAFIDVDNDGLEDLLQVNGHTNPDPERPGALRGQPAYLWRMKEPSAFTFAGAPPEDPLAKKRVGRGAAFGDVDRDGYVDVVVGNNNEPGELWLSRGGPKAWLGLTLIGTRSNRNATGAKVTLSRGAHVRMKQVTSGESFYSSNARDVMFGLADGEGPATCRVRWPSGLVEDFAELATRRYHRCVEGQGRTAAP